MADDEAILEAFASGLSSGAASALIHYGVAPDPLAAKIGRAMARGMMSDPAARFEVLELLRNPNPPEISAIPVWGEGL